MSQTTTRTPDSPPQGQLPTPPAAPVLIAEGEGPGGRAVYHIHGNPNLSAEQRAKYDELIEWLRERAAATARMTPEELAQADAEWELFKNSMNDERRRAGARILYPE